MYAEFSNQLLNMSKYSMAFLFLYLILPHLILGKIDEDKADNLVAQYIRAVFFVIVIGFILATFKVYEFITLSGIILFLLYRRIAAAANLMGKRSREDIGLFLLYFLDNQVTILKATAFKLFNLIKEQKGQALKLDAEKVLFFILISSVLLLTIYIRFYDAVVHAAMPLSDSYITLDWMKAVERRQLFYEPGGGIYPRGLSIFMQTIRKFSFIDPIYVLKYTGPLNGVLISFSIFYAVRQLTKNKYAALIAAAAYGIGAGLLGSDIVRQAATNSQEFALVFLMPTIYFANKYMQQRRRRDLFTASMGLTLMGLIHTFVYAFAVLAVGITIFILFVTGPVKNFKDCLKLTGGGILSAVISLIPLAAGLLQGVGLHSTSVGFLTATEDIVLSQFAVIDYIEAITLGFLGICLLQMFKRRDEKAYSLLSIYLTVILVFILYEAGGYLTGSTLLDTRSQEVWAVCSALMFGLTIGMSLFNIKNLKLLNKTSIITCMIAIAMAININGIKPLDPYKMEWDSGVEQYFRITKEYLPKTWTMVAEQRQYAMIQGSGFLLTTESFVKVFNPDHPFSDNWLAIGEHIFIYQQKRIFEVDKDNSVYSFEKPKYDQMRIDGEAMNEWLERFRAAGGTYEVYYEDQNIRMLSIYNKSYNFTKKVKIWGEDS